MNSTDITCEQIAEYESEGMISLRIRDLIKQGAQARLGVSVLSEENRPKVTYGWIDYAGDPRESRLVLADRTCTHFLPAVATVDVAERLERGIDAYRNSFMVGDHVFRIGDHDLLTHVDLFSEDLFEKGLSIKPVFVSSVPDETVSPAGEEILFS